MKVIGGGRRSGRTTRLIQLTAEADKRGEVAYIVCHNQTEAYRISQVAKEMDLNIRFPITYDEVYGDRLHGSFVNNLLIDNVELFIPRMLPWLPITTVSICTDENLER